MSRASQWFGSFLKDPSGRVPIEYAVALALIVVGVIYGVRNMGNATSNQDNATSNMLNGGPIPASAGGPSGSSTSGS